MVIHIRLQASIPPSALYLHGRNFELAYNTVGYTAKLSADGSILVTKGTVDHALQLSISVSPA
jgi:hypothetical protein